MAQCFASVAARLALQLWPERLIVAETLPVFSCFSFMICFFLCLCLLLLPMALQLFCPLRAHMATNMSTCIYIYISFPFAYCLLLSAIAIVWNLIQTGFGLICAVGFSVVVGTCCLDFLYMKPYLLLVVLVL